MTQLMDPPDPFLTEEQRRLRQGLRPWVEEHLYPLSEAAEGESEPALRLVSMLGEKRLLSYVAERPFGGMRDRVDARDLCVIREELARGSGLADVMFAMQGLGSYPITLAGTGEQKKRYLPDVVRGRLVAAFALTEPEAGSDVQAVQTQAVRDGADYRLEGVKHLISNAGIAHFYVVFARTSPERGGRSLSAFVVEEGTPGFVLKERTPLMAPHPVGTLAFEGCKVPGSHLLGSEGEGLRIALTTLDLFRPTVGAAALGMARRALEEALDHSKGRRQFGKTLSEFQAIQIMLAEMATWLDAARLLVYRAAWVKESGNLEHLRRVSAMAKWYATEVSQKIVDHALQIHGGRGVVRGVVVERLYREIRALRIYEGTSEIQKLIIAKDLLAKDLLARDFLKERAGDGL